ncbi:MAG: hypothetical protein FWE86_04490 [Oscillospiraceae bacterium]|nr:hypothetical protein [Oscillospiraceae bacterium]
MEYIIQAFTGGYKSKSPWTPREVLTRISSVMDILPVRSVIIGWNGRTELYYPLIDEVHRRGKKIFAWLPVFSEMSAFDEAFRAVDFAGASHGGAKVSGDDDFLFLCPSRRQNIELAIRVYKDCFAKSDFDGIFLDKIRYASFGNGFNAAMGCFCGECRREYQKRGIDHEKIIALLGGEEKPFLSPAALEGMRYRFDDPLIDGFFRARADIISSSVFELTDWFKGRGLAVGLDVYAPVFAYYVGQDISALSQKADFIKPMMYRITDAPAGVPYEHRRMRQELGACGCGIDGRLEGLWGVDDICGDSAFRAQAEGLKQARCEINIGIEVNDKPGICVSDGAYAAGTIDMIDKSGLGCVLSWDVLSAPEATLRAIAEHNAIYGGIADEPAE